MTGAAEPGLGAPPAGIPLQTRFDAHLAGLGLPGGLALLAVSGGGDSLALLDLMVHSPAAGALRLAVLHVDHGIHPDSARVAAAVVETAARYGVEAIVERLRLGPRVSETRARAARWAALERVRETSQARYLFTAHHADDQVETVLMRFLRGSGPAGQAGIAVESGRVVRPLLWSTRGELAEHARAAGLDVWEDPANSDPRHDRAWLRSRILPLLQGRWPELRANLLRGAALRREERQAWDDLLNGLLELDFEARPDLVSVAAPPLRGYSSSLVAALVRALARSAGVGLAGHHVERIGNLVRMVQGGRGVDVGGGWRVEVSGDRLRLFRPPKHPLRGEVAIREPQGAARLGRWHFAWRMEPAPGAMERIAGVTWVVPGARCSARPWRAGDRIRPLGGRGSRLVVRCMQDVKVARGDRPEWPVLVGNGGVVWVPEVCRSDSLVPSPGTDAVRIDARRD